MVELHKRLSASYDQENILDLLNGMYPLIPRVDTSRSCLGEDSSVGLGSCPRVNTLYIHATRDAVPALNGMNFFFWNQKNLQNLRLRYK